MSLLCKRITNQLIKVTTRDCNLYFALDRQSLNCWIIIEVARRVHTENINKILTNCTKSTTGTFPSLSALQSVRPFSPTNDHNLSKLIDGQKLWFRFKWKFRIPNLPKYPGWYLSKLILWWCIPPALPRPPGCLRCFPIKICRINLYLTSIFTKTFANLF